MLFPATKGIDHEATYKQANRDPNADLHHTESNREACRVRIALLTAIVLCKPTSGSDTRL